MPPCQRNTHSLSQSRTASVDEEMKDVHAAKDPPPKGIITPNDTDVLCGRGGNINTHPGNGTFRRLVEKNKRIYLTARFKREKRLIAEGILNDIKSQNPPGRFLLKKDDEWFEVPFDKARDKTSQALREGAPKLREEMQNELQERRREEQSSPQQPDYPNNNDYYGRETHQGYEFQNQNQSNRFGYNNIMDTMANAFGCPTNLHDVRDDDRMTHGDRNRYAYTNGSYQHDSSGWDQSRYYESEPPQEYSNYRHTNDGHNESPNQPCNHYTTNSYQDSPNDVRFTGMEYGRSQKKVRTASPVDSAMDYEPAHQYDSRTPPPIEHEFDQSCTSWTSSFCQSNLFDIAKWTIYGDQPENNIPKVNSIEIDEPVSPNELKGSSLVNVFEDSASSLPVKNENDSMMSLNDSALNDSALTLLNAPSLDMQFST